VQDGGSCSAGPVLPPDNGCGFFMSDGGVDAGNFPTFANCCQVDTDCAIAAHQTTCCGDIFAAGINVNQVTAFATARASWTCGGCACASGGIHLQDGNNTGTFSTVAVSCLQGACVTHLTATTCQVASVTGVSKLP